MRPASVTSGPVEGSQRAATALPARFHPVRLLSGGLFWHAVALALLFLVWALVAQVAGKGFLPTPVETAEETVALLKEGDTYTAMLTTARRVVIAAVLAGAAGIMLGLLMGLSRSAEAFLKPYVLVMLAIPGPFYIIMALVILGIGESSTLTALIISVLPFAANLTYQGVTSRDVKLDEMAAVYRLRRAFWMRHVLVPQLAPTLLAASRTSFSLAWKLVVLMEILSAPDGVGAELNTAFRLLQPDAVIGYVAIFMLFMLVVEILVFKRAERGLLRWQPNRRAVAVATPE